MARSLLQSGNYVPVLSAAGRRSPEVPRFSSAQFPSGAYNAGSPSPATRDMMSPKPQYRGEGVWSPVALQPWTPSSSQSVQRQMSCRDLRPSQSASALRPSQSARDLHDVRGPNTPVPLSELREGSRGRSPDSVSNINGMARDRGAPLGSSPGQRYRSPSPSSLSLNASYEYAKATSMVDLDRSPSGVNSQYHGQGSLPRLDQIWPQSGPMPQTGRRPLGSFSYAERPEPQTQQYANARGWNLGVQYTKDMPPPVKMEGWAMLHLHSGSEFEALVVTKYSHVYMKISGWVLQMWQNEQDVHRNTRGYSNARPLSWIDLRRVHGVELIKLYGEYGGHELVIHCNDGHMRLRLLSDGPTWQKALHKIIYAESLRKSKTSARKKSTKPRRARIEEILEDLRYVNKAASTGETKLVMQSLFSVVDESGDGELEVTEVMSLIKEIWEVRREGLLKFIEAEQKRLHYAGDSLVHPQHQKTRRLQAEASKLLRWYESALHPGKLNEQAMLFSEQGDTTHDGRLKVDEFCRMSVNWLFPNQLLHDERTFYRHFARATH